MKRFAVVVMLAALAVCCYRLFADDRTDGGAVTAPQALMAGINVRDVGAVGDGKHDDTEAFKKAIEMTGKVEPGDEKYFDPKLILVPPGHYRITETLKIDCRDKSVPRNGLKIVGATGPHHGWRQPGPHGDPKLYTEIFWDGAEDQVLFDCRATMRMEFTGMLLNGRSKTSALISVNSPGGFGSAEHVFTRITMVNSKIGFEVGSDTVICSSDMSFYDVGWVDCEIGFRANSGQNLNYVFIRPGAANTGVMFDFAKGGSAVMTLPATYAVGTFLRVGEGGINAGTFTVDGCRLDGNRYRGKRTVLVDAKGETNIVFSGLLTGCTGLFPEKNKDGTFGELPENTPLFILGRSASVVVQGSMISGNIAQLTGDPRSVPTWIQFDGCRFRVRSDPRTMITTDEFSGFQLRNCTIQEDSFVDGQYHGGRPAFVEDLRKSPAQARASE